MADKTEWNYTPSDRKKSADDHDPPADERVEWTNPAFGLAEIPKAAENISTNECDEVSMTSTVDTASVCDAASACDSTSESPLIEWGVQEHKPEVFNINIDLPVVVKFKEDKDAGTLDPGLKIYSEQPVLFYKRVKKKETNARTIYRDKSGPYYEVGQTLLIPEDFDGWLEIVPPDFTRVGFYRSFAEIAEVMPKKIFIRTPVSGIRPKKNENGDLTYVERKVREGSVLRVESVFAATWKTTAETGVMTKKKTEFTYQTKYLKCKDPERKEIMVPVTQKGRFNAVYEKDKEYKHSIYSIKNLLSDFTLPLKVRVLYGKSPANPCIFTGMMILREVNSRDTIIASTIVNKRNVLFDVPVDTPCKCLLAENEQNFAETKQYGDAKKLCDKYGLVYSSMIRLSAKMDTDQKMVQHIPSEKNSRDESLKTLDLLNNISLTDDEPHSIFLGDSSGSDTASRGSVGSGAILLTGDNLMELKEISSA